MLYTVYSKNKELCTIDIDENNLSTVRSYKWRLAKNKYLITTSNSTRKTVMLNRLLMACPKDKYVVHKDGNYFNYCLDNLVLKSKSDYLKRNK